MSVKRPDNKPFDELNEDGSCKKHPQHSPEAGYYCGHCLSELGDHWKLYAIDLEAELKLAKAEVELAWKDRDDALDEILELKAELTRLKSSPHDEGELVRALEAMIEFYAGPRTEPEMPVITEAKQVLARRAKGGAGRTMETAPRDGTKVLLSCENGWQIGSWEKGVPDEELRPGIPAAWIDDGEGFPISPKAWLPLPPTADEKGEV